MKIAIYGKPHFKSPDAAVPQLLEHIAAHGFDFAVYERFAGHLRETGMLTTHVPTFNRENVDIATFSLLISIGGDGTLLDTVTIVGDSGVPIVGLHAGRLGFISGLELDEVHTVLALLKKGELPAEERLLISLKTNRNLFGDKAYALNEVTLHKRDNAAMVRFDTWIDEQPFGTYWADGLIISTPTGSTAYSLSCGGPIMLPHSETLVITPIAPHNLTVRPVVVSAAARIRVRLSGRGEHFLIAADSRSDTLQPEEDVYISKAPFTIKLVKPAGHSFAQTLRQKLGWGLDKRN
jgi:NAD+ kinase